MLSLPVFTRRWLCLAALAGAAHAAAADAPLTLAAAQQLAVRHSSLLPAKNLATAAAREMAVAAAQLPDPVLKAGIDNLPVSGAGKFSLGSDFMTMRRIGVMQELTGSDKRHWRAEKSRREAERAQAAREAARASVERETALAWLERYYTEQMAAVVAEQAGQSRLEVAAAEGAYRAGRGSQADILAARSALGMAEDQADEWQRRVRTARTMLVRWTGSDAGLAGTPPITTLSMLAQASHHPDIGILGRQQDIAEAEVRLAQANEKPDWSVEVAFQQRGPAYANMVSFGVSVPLQWDRKQRQDRELAARLAMLDEAKAEREEMLREHAASIESMLEEWRSGRARMERFAASLLPLAAQRTQAVAAAYRGGKASLSELLLAQRSDIDTRLQSLQLQLNTARVWAQLQFILPGQTGAAQ